MGARITPLPGGQLAAVLAFPPPRKCIVVRLDLYPSNCRRASSRPGRGCSDPVGKNPTLRSLSLPNTSCNGPTPAQVAAPISVPPRPTIPSSHTPCSHIISHFHNYIFFSFNTVLTNSLLVTDERPHPGERQADAGPAHAPPGRVGRHGRRRGQRAESLCGSVGEVSDAESG